MPVAVVPNGWRLGSVRVQSGRWLRGGGRRSVRAPLWLTAAMLPIAGCSHSPSLNLLGSYFPAWMLCAVIGIVVSVIIRQILALIGINEYVIAPLLTYVALALFVTFLVWLLWFSH